MHYNQSARATRAGEYRALVSFSVPLTITSASYVALGILDTWFMGQVGTAEQAGTAIGVAVSVTIGSFLWGTLSVVESFVGQHLGAALASGSDPRALHRCGQAQREGLVLGAALAAVTLGFTALVPWIVRAFGAPPAVTEVAIAYATVRTIGTAVTCLSEVLKGFFRAIGKPIVVTVLALLLVAANVPLNRWLIFGGLGLPPMGAAGAACSTLVLIILELVALILIYAWGPFARRFGPLLGPVDWSSVGSQLRVGVPLGVSWLAVHCGSACFWGIIGRFGEASLSAHAIMTQLARLLVLPGQAVGGAAANLVAPALGSGRPGRARSVFQSAMTLVLGCALILSVLIGLSGRELGGLFSRDAEVVVIVSDLVRWLIPLLVFTGVADVARGVLRGAGDSQRVLLSSIVEPFVVLMPLTWLLSVHLGGGLSGAWVASVISTAVIAALLLTYAWTGAWARQSLLSPDAGAPADPVLELEEARDRAGSRARQPALAAD